ncbi:MAG: hypothetical protein WHS65_01740 [Melioribacteraceae bacterium]
MNKKQLFNEWKKLNSELFEKKPKINGSYPYFIVKRRELLLFAQVHLSNIIEAKSRKDKWDEKFETEMYYKVMNEYYNWYKNE